MPDERRRGSFPSSENGQGEEVVSAGLRGIVESLVAARDEGAPVVLGIPRSMEGVLGGVALTYLAHSDPSSTRVCDRKELQPGLLERVLLVSEASEDELVPLARRVWQSLGRRCGAGCTNRILYACASDDQGMPQVVSRYVRLSFSLGRTVTTSLAHADVLAIDTLARQVSSECEKTRQFARFSHLPSGGWFCSFSPRANTLPLCAQHFSRRMRGDRFCMLDPVHGVAVFHEAGERTARVARLDPGMVRQMGERASDVDAEERRFQEMWATFYRSMELPGRDAASRGYDLRIQFMPKRLWDSLPELAKTPASPFAGWASKPQGAVGQQRIGDS